MEEAKIDFLVNVWDRFNPKKKEGRSSFFKVHNDIFFDQAFFGVELKDMGFLMFILGACAREGSARLSFSLAYLQHHLRIDARELSECIKRLSSKGIVSFVKEKDKDPDPHKEEDEKIVPEKEKEEIKEEVKESVRNVESLKEPSPKEEALITKEQNHQKKESTVFSGCLSALEEVDNDLSQRNIIKEFNNVQGLSPYPGFMFSSEMMQSFKECKQIGILQTMKEWREMFFKVSKSEFLMKEYRPTLNWIIKPDNALKIIAGGYDNKPPKTKEKLEVDENPFRRARLEQEAKEAAAKQKEEDEKYDFFKY